MIDRMACKLADGRAGVHSPCAGVQTDVHACMCQVLACTSTCMRACARCRRAHRPACVHVPGAGVHIGVLACTWVAQAYRRDIPGCQTDVHACSLMPTKSIQYCRRAAAIESEQQLQRELDLSRGRCGVCDDPARGAVVGALENNLIRVREI